MKRLSLLASLAFLLLSLNINAQDAESQIFDGANCTSIMVGKDASTDGSVMTSTPATACTAHGFAGKKQNNMKKALPRKYTEEACTPETHTTAKAWNMLARFHKQNTHILILIQHTHA